MTPCVSAFLSSYHKPTESLKKANKDQFLEKYTDMQTGENINMLL